MKNNEKINLSETSANLYYKMTAYLSEKRLVRREYNRICDDILLMLTDAEARGENAEQLFPEGIKKFCDDVAANSDKEKWYQTALGILEWTSAMFALLLLINVFFVRVWADEGEWISGVNMRLGLDGLLSNIIITVGGGAIGYIVNRYTVEKSRKAIAVIIGLIAVIIVAAILLDRFMNRIFVELNWVVAVCVSVAVAASICAVQRVISSLQAKP